MRPLMGNELLQRLSIYNNDYYCIIEKIEFMPGIIRIFIDERGDDSLGPLQDPLSSRLGIFTEDSLANSKNPTNGHFPISDASRQYHGHLDFSLDSYFLDGEHTIGFEYGAGGYSTVKLFCLNQELIKKYNIKST